MKSVVFIRKPPLTFHLLGNEGWYVHVLLALTCAKLLRGWIFPNLDFTVNCSSRLKALGLPRVFEESTDWSRLIILR